MLSDNKEAKEQLELMLQEVQKTLSKINLSGHPKELYEPITYLLGLGGKRLRPILCLLGYQLFKKDFETALEPALALEVFHNFTLMHDDIMDKAPLRRGKPTVHEKWNENVAILSGDVMLVQAYQLLLGVPEDKLKRILERFNLIAAGVCEGQQLDMNFELRESVSASEYIEMIRLKTAVLLGFSVELGARLAGVSEEAALKTYQYGENLGLGFQIMDDWLDSFGTPQAVGKKPGGDICANKKTFLWIKLQELGGKQIETQLKEMSLWPKEKELEKVEAVLKLYNQFQIGELSLQLMDSYFIEAQMLLNELEALKEGKELLANYAKVLATRKN